MENQKDYKLPLGLFKQSIMKLDSAMTDINEIMEDPDIDDDDRQLLGQMNEILCTMVATMVNIVHREVNEEEFIAETIPMDDIDEYPDFKYDDNDILSNEI